MPSLPLESSVPIFCSYNCKKVLFSVRLCESCQSTYVELLFCNASYKKVASPFAPKTRIPPFSQISFQYNVKEAHRLGRGPINYRQLDSVSLADNGRDETERKVSDRILIQPSSMQAPARGTNQLRPVAASIAISSKSNTRKAIIKKAIQEYDSRNRIRLFRRDYNITLKNTCGIQYLVVFKLKKKLLSDL